MKIIIGEEVTHLIGTLVGEIQRLQEDNNRLTKKSKLEFSQMSDHEVVHETLLKKLSYKTLQVIKVVVFLSKCRNNHSSEDMAYRFGTSVATVKRYITDARKILSTFAADNHGLTHRSREDFIKETSVVAKKLIGEGRLAICCDTTYLYCEKSSLHVIQRDTYSVHKGRNLVKFMNETTTNGYVIESAGPWPANLNDAAILQEMLQIQEFKDLNRKTISY